MHVNRYRHLSAIASTKTITTTPHPKYILYLPLTLSQHHTFFLVLCFSYCCYVMVTGGPVTGPEDDEEELPDGDHPLPSRCRGRSRERFRNHGMFRRWSSNFHINAWKLSMGGNPQFELGIGAETYLMMIIPLPILLGLGLGSVRMLQLFQTRGERGYYYCTREDLLFAP